MSILTITKLMAMKLLKMENGNIDLFGRLGFIMPAENILSMHEALEKRFGKEAADEAIYEAGLGQSATGAKKYFERSRDIRTVYNNPSMTGNASLEMGREMLKLTGLGDIRIKEVINSGERVVISTANSPFASEYLKTRGKSKAPVCHYLRGLLMGVAGAYSKNPYRSAEKVCRACGIGQECVFEFVRIDPKPE